MPDSTKRQFEELYNATYQRVTAYCRRRTRSEADADDAVAATYLVAWRRLDDVLAADHPIAWLYGVAYRTLSNQYRARRRAAALRGRLFGVPPRATPTPDWIFEQQADVAAAFAALGSLTAADQELIRLAAFEELSYTEIAVASDTSTSAGAVPAVSSSGTAACRLRRATGRCRTWPGGDVVIRNDVTRSDTGRRNKARAQTVWCPCETPVEDWRVSWPAGTLRDRPPPPGAGRARSKKFTTRPRCQKIGDPSANSTRGTGRSIRSDPSAGRPQREERNDRALNPAGRSRARRDRVPEGQDREARTPRHARRGTPGPPPYNGGRSGSPPASSAEGRASHSDFRADA